MFYILSTGLMNCFFHESGFTGLMKPACVAGLIVCINQNPPESATNTLCASSLVHVTESRDHKSHQSNCLYPGCPLVPSVIAEEGR